MAEWHLMLHHRVLHRFWVKEGDAVTIGRGKSTDVTIDNVAVSRQHARLSMRNGTHFLSDLGSSNGTSVNGVKINGAVPVTEADRIEIGKFRLVLMPAPAPLNDIEETVLTAPKGKPGRAKKGGTMTDEIDP